VVVDLICHIDNPVHGKLIAAVLLGS